MTTKTFCDYCKKDCTKEGHTILELKSSKGLVILVRDLCNDCSERFCRLIGEKA